MMTDHSKRGMSWEAKHRKVYEDRIIKEVLGRFSDSIGKESVPFAENELLTLAKRHREAFYGSDRKKERLTKYMAHLSALYGNAIVTYVSSKLQDIINQLGYEEK